MKFLRLGSGCFPILVALTTLTSCVKHIDPANQYLGTYDCQVSVTESNLPNNRTKASQGIFTVVISRAKGDSLSVAQDGFINLSLTAGLGSGNKLILPLQSVVVANSLSNFSGVMATTGSGSTDGNRLTFSYTATQGAGKYTFAAQLSGIRR